MLSGIYLNLALVKHYPDDDSGTCSAKNYIDAKLSDGKLVAWGTLEKETSNQTLSAESGEASDLGETIPDKNPSGLDKEVLYTTAGAQQYTEEYYYLVVEYPDNGDQTATDAGGKTISISLDTISNIQSTLVTE